MQWKSPEEWEKLKQGIDCPMCADIHLVENQFSFLLAELSQSYARLSKNQYHKGYTVVALKRHANELFELAPEELAGYWKDVAQVAKALYTVYQPAKINYLIYGHHIPHIHCHMLVHFFEEDPSKVVNLGEGEKYLATAEYQQKIAKIREQL
jgi:diadenosine tetraphosphate (Ap4A) HIT family hydrolase